MDGVNFDQQITLAASVEVAGVGLHSGREVVVTLRPASVDTGIVFKRVDLGEEMTADAFCTAHTPLQTKMAGAFGGEIETPEHLLAALYGLGVDNCIIELSSAEIPILDGSALPWVEAVDKAGRCVQEKLRRYVLIEEPVHVDYEGRVLAAVPDGRAGLRLEVMVDFPVLGKDTLKAKVTEDFFRKEIAPARTFCFERDVKAMQAAGLALGGSLDNAVVFDDAGKPLNSKGLRYENEFVRHKFLDALGDLYLGGRLSGKVSLPMPGHTANNVLLRKVIEKSKG